MPVPAYWHSYNYVKIVSISTRETKLKKILINQEDVIRIIFHVNEETCPRPSFQELLLSMYVKQTYSKSSYSCK